MKLETEFLRLITQRADATITWSSFKEGRGLDIYYAPGQIPGNLSVYQSVDDGDHWEQKQVASEEELRDCFRWLDVGEE